jgi:hypothetical protein
MAHCVVVVRFPGVSAREGLEVYRRIAVSDRRDELAGPARGPATDEWWRSGAKASARRLRF